MNPNEEKIILITINLLNQLNIIKNNTKDENTYCEIREMINFHKKNSICSAIYNKSTKYEYLKSLLFTELLITVVTYPKTVYIHAPNCLHLSTLFSIQNAPPH